MWIKCKDRLPNGDSACLCWNDQRKCVEIFLFWQGKWSTLSSEHVTHWMPLPAPPKSGAEEAVEQPLTQAKAAEALPEWEICPRCKGDGHGSVGGFATDVKCSKCNGTGKLPLA